MVKFYRYLSGLNRLCKSGVVKEKKDHINELRLSLAKMNRRVYRTNNDPQQEDK